jgi:hypothetical protein
MKSFSSHLQRLGAGIVLAALALATSAGFASAQPWYNGPPPPPPRFERHPARAGFVWEAGHWSRVAGRWVWVPGRYVAVAAGRHWVAGHWRFGPLGRYWVPGHWAA